MRQDIDIDLLMTETWLTVTMLKKGAVTLNGTALYNKCVAPGQVLEPQGDVITALKEGVILTLVTFRGARDSRLHVSVWGMPYTERYCFRPTEIPRPEIHGTLPARVESREKNDIYAHLDEQGRYRVWYDGVVHTQSEADYGSRKQSSVSRTSIFTRARRCFSQELYSC